MFRRILGFISVHALAVVLPSTALAADPITLRFSSFEPPVAFVTKQILTPWAQRVTADSQGTLKVEMYPGGMLGRDPAAQLKLVLDGVADIAWIVPGYTPGRFDAATVVELPFIVQSAHAGSVASWRMYQKGLWKGGGFEDVKMLCVCTNTPVFVNTTYPATKLSDLKGRKFRAAGPVSLNVIKSLGGTPIGGITGPQLAENLSRGLVDGTLNEWNALQTFRALEVVKNHIILPLGATSLMVVMNKDKYASLPAAAKAAVDKHSGEAFAKVFGTMFDKNNNSVFETAKKDRSRVITILTDKEQTPWREALVPVAAGWKSSFANGDQLVRAFSEEAKTVGSSR